MSRARWRAVGMVGNIGVLRLARRGGVATWPRSRAVKGKGEEGFGGRAVSAGGWSTKSPAWPPARTHLARRVLPR